MRCGGRRRARPSRAPAPAHETRRHRWRLRAAAAASLVRLAAMLWRRRASDSLTVARMIAGLGDLSFFLVRLTQARSRSRSFAMRHALRRRRRAIAVCAAATSSPKESIGRKRQAANQRPSVNPCSTRCRARRRTRSARSSRVRETKSAATAPSPMSPIRACRTRKPAMHARCRSRLPALLRRAGRHSPRMYSMTHASRTSTTTPNTMAAKPQASQISDGFKRLDDLAGLQAHEKKRQHVQQKHDGFPHRVGINAFAGRRAFGQQMRDRHAVGDDAKNGRQMQMLGDDPGAERHDEAHQRGAQRSRHPPHHPREHRADSDAQQNSARHRERKFRNEMDSAGCRR